MSRFIRELTWQQFSSQSHIKQLPINEQMRQFRFHLEEVSNYINFQGKGPKRVVSTPLATATPIPATSTPIPATSTPIPATATPSPTATAIPATSTPTPTVVPGSGVQFFLDTLDTSNTAAQEGGTDIRYAFDLNTYINGVFDYPWSNYQPEPGGTLGVTTSGNWGSVDELRLTLRRIAPDNTTFHNATVNITALNGTLGTVELIGTPDKPLPYAVSPGTTISGGNDWTWRVTGFSSDLWAQFSVSEKP